MDELKKKILEAQETGDIAALYMLEQEAHAAFDDETLGAYYTNILEQALERLTEALESCRKMKMDDVQDFATLRALYEYAVEHYSAGSPADAAALFEVLSGLSDDEEFGRAMTLHRMAASKNISLDDFINTIADVEATQQAGTFYICAFREKARELLDDEANETGAQG